MKNKIYKIIYICGLLIHSQASIGSELNEMNNTIIPEEENIIPEIQKEVIKQEINIDMDLLSNSKLVFISFYAIMFVVIFVVMILVMILVVILFDKSNDDDNFIGNFLANYINQKNTRIIIEGLEINILLYPLIIPILSYIVIAIINTNKYTSKYMKQNALFKSWCLYMLLMLVYIISVSKGWTTFTQIKDFKEISRIFLIFGKYDADKTNDIPFIMFMRSIICTLIFNNITLFSSYSMLKRYYQRNPIKYKEKRDHINSLNNNITPVNVLDNNLDNLSPVNN